MKGAYQNDHRFVICHIRSDRRGKKSIGGMGFFSKAPLRVARKAWLNISGPSVRMPIQCECFGDVEALLMHKPLLETDGGWNTRHWVFGWSRVYT